MVQKISDFRVPINTSVKLTFTRRVHKDGTPEVVHFDNGPAATPVYTQPTETADSSNNNSNSDNNYTNTNTNNSDSYPRSPNNASSYNFDNSPPEGPPGSPDWASTSMYQQPHLDPVQYVAAMSENEELKSDLETSLQQLNLTYHERDQLQADNQSVKAEVCHSSLLLRMVCG